MIGGVSCVVRSGCLLILQGPVVMLLPAFKGLAAYACGQGLRLLAVTGCGLSLCAVECTKRCTLTRACGCIPRVNHVHVTSGCKRFPSSCVAWPSKGGTQQAAATAKHQGASLSDKLQLSFVADTQATACKFTAHKTGTELYIGPQIMGLQGSLP